MKFAELISQAKNFIEKGLWHIEDTPIGQANRRLFGLLKIIVLTVKGFVEEKVTIRASALTYFTLLSIVPVIALAFAISKGFGLETYLTDYIRSSLGTAPETADYLIEFATSALENAKGGLIAGVGVVMLIYSVFKLLSNIEDAFNKMWCIKQSRTLVRKITDYVSIMIFAPILLILSSSATIFLRSFMSKIMVGYFTPFQEILLKSAPYVLMWIVFTLLYLVMPNTKVNIKAALISGVITGTAFQVVQWVYITFQVGVNNAGSVYGSFAFLPLFLAWLQLTWTIVLAGCKISFAIQNVSKYSLEYGVQDISIGLEKRVAALIMLRIVRKFVGEEKATDGLQLVNEIEISQSFFYHIMDKLKACGLVAEVTTDNDEMRTFIPSVDVSIITPNLVYDRLDNMGEDTTFHIVNDEDYKYINKTFEEIRRNGTDKCGNTPFCTDTKNEIAEQQG